MSLKFHSRRDTVLPRRRTLLASVTAGTPLTFLKGNFVRSRLGIALLTPALALISFTATAVVSTAVVPTPAAAQEPPAGPPAHTDEYRLRSVEWEGQQVSALLVDKYGDPTPYLNYPSDRESWSPDRPPKPSLLVRNERNGETLSQRVSLDRCTTFHQDKQLSEEDRRLRCQGDVNAWEREKSSMWGEFEWSVPNGRQEVYRVCAKPHRPVAEWQGKWLCTTSIPLNNWNPHGKFQKR